MPRRLGRAVAIGTWNVVSFSHSEVAQLYADLDGGFTPINFLLPNVPFPANARRDAAQIKLRDLFIGIMNQRRQHADQVRIGWQAAARVHRASPSESTWT